MRALEFACAGVRVRWGLRALGFAYAGVRVRWGSRALGFALEFALVGVRSSRRALE